MSNKNVLPSSHQINDEVSLVFGIEATIKNCRVTMVHFSESTIFYDVEARMRYDIESDSKMTERLYKIPSVFVVKRSLIEQK